MKKTFNVRGMHCKSCQMVIIDAVSEIDGVKTVDVSLTKNTVTIDYDENITKDDVIKKVIEKEGYKVRS